MAGPIRPGGVEDGAGGAEPIPEEATQATRGRYGVAELAVGLLLGRVRPLTDDPEPPSPDALHEAAIDLAIDCLCDDRHHVAEVVAGAAGWLLLKHGGGRSGSWATQRAKRMLALVGARFPREA